MLVISLFSMLIYSPTKSLQSLILIKNIYRRKTKYRSEVFPILCSPNGYYINAKARVEPWKLYRTVRYYIENCDIPNVYINPDTFKTVFFLKHCPH